MIFTLIVYLILAFFILKLIKIKKYIIWKTLCFTFILMIGSILLLSLVSNYSREVELSIGYGILKHPINGLLGLATYLVPHFLLLLGLLGWGGSAFSKSK